MKRLTALLAAVLALAMMTGPSVASELSRQLAPNVFGPGYFSDGVSDEEFRGTIDTHYGIAPAWEGRAEEPVTMIEKTENVLWKQLAPNVFGPGYFADGVSDEVFRGTIDKHYGVAPAWEGRPEEPATMIEKTEKVLWKQLAPNANYGKDIH